MRLALFPLLAIAAVFCLASGRALAQAQTPISAVQLQKMCTSRYDIDVGICAGYVTAVAEALMNENNPSQPICLSPAISPQSLMDNLLKVWSESPPGPEMTAADAVKRTLRIRFRCP